MKSNSGLATPRSKRQFDQCTLAGTAFSSSVKKCLSAARAFAMSTCFSNFFQFVFDRSCQSIDFFFLSSHQRIISYGGSCRCCCGSGRVHGHRVTHLSRCQRSVRTGKHNCHHRCCDGCDGRVIILLLCGKSDCSCYSWLLGAALIFWRSVHKRDVEWDKYVAGRSMRTQTSITDNSNTSSIGLHAVDQHHGLCGDCLC